MKSLFGALALLFAALPAHAAELSVRAAPAKAKVFESVLITVEAPEPGPAETPPPAVMLTIADARDRRQSQRMLPAGPRRWQVRFTPQTVGRHTGTVVLEAGEDREIGLVPAIDVRASASRGFVRSVAAGGRMFECDAGGLFPMGVAIPAAAASSAVWQDEFARLRSYGVNFVRLDLPWDPAFPAAATEPKAAEAADRWLLAAEKAGLFVQLRLLAPRVTDAASRAAYAGLVEFAADRWGPFASLAAWELDPTAFRGDSGSLRGTVAALRQRDAQHHLIALQAQSSADPAWSAGADFVVTRDAPAASRRSNPSWPAPVLLLGAAGPVDPWEGLFSAGLGIPLANHRAGVDPAWDLPELPAVAEVAKSVPWGVPARATVAQAEGTSAALRWRCYGDVVLLRAEPRSGDGAAAEPGADALVRGIAPGARLRVFRADGSVARQEPLTPEGGEVAIHLREPGRRAVVAAITVDAPAAALKPARRGKRGKRR